MRISGSITYSIFEEEVDAEAYELTNGGDISFVKNIKDNILEYETYTGT